MKTDFSQGGARYSDNAALRGFVATIASDFCPFIEPSRANNILTFSDYTQSELAQVGDGNITAGLFYIGVAHTERLRKHRADLRAINMTAAAALICDNVTILGSEQLDWRTAKNTIDWPHYLLKVLYSEVGIMFGKFWTHEEGTSLDGRSIPTTPTTFLSIRSAIRLRDPSLLREQIDFADVIRSAADNGQDVLAQSLGIEGANVTAELLARRNAFKLLKEWVLKREGRTGS